MKYALAYEHRIGFDVSSSVELEESVSFDLFCEVMLLLLMVWLVWLVDDVTLSSTQLRHSNGRIFSKSPVLKSCRFPGSIDAIKNLKR